MRIHWSSLLTAMPLVLGGCYAADLDETADALFACKVSGEADEADADCPGELQCNGRVCVERLPTVTITSPEVLEVLELDDEVIVTLRVTGLRFSTDENDADGGFVRVTLDGEFFDIRTGDLSGPLVVENLVVPATPGAHRISAQAFRVDGTPFDNDTATAAQVFWRTDGLPHVAITKPWPGTEFELQTNGLVDVEVAMLNFSYGQTDTALAQDTGHIHVYYDDDFPACAEESVCDAGYIGVISAAPEESGLGLGTLSEGILFPDSPAADATLTAVLTHNSHSAFSNTDGELDLVMDTVQITRAAN